MSVRRSSLTTAASTSRRQSLYAIGVDRRSEWLLLALSNINIKSQQATFKSSFSGFVSIFVWSYKIYPLTTASQKGIVQTSLFLGEHFLLPLSMWSRQCTPYVWRRGRSGCCGVLSLSLGRQPNDQSPDPPTCRIYAMSP